MGFIRSEGDLIVHTVKGQTCQIAEEAIVYGADIGVVAIRIVMTAFGDEVVVADIGHTRIGRAEVGVVAIGHGMAAAPDGRVDAQVGHAVVVGAEIAVVAFGDRHATIGIGRVDTLVEITKRYQVRRCRLPSGTCG